MRRLTVSPVAFQRLAAASAVLLAAIVVTGGAVRLSGSGLGCHSWPNCERGELIPASGLHPWVEMGNRLVSAAVGIVVVATALAALVRSRRRRDLTLLAWGLVGGFVLQAVIGGLSVIYKLSPGWVMAHFLASMLLLWDAIALWVRAQPGWSPDRLLAPRPEIRWLARGTAAVAAVVLVAGTVVTGSGPHAGDPHAVHRFGFPLDNVAQAHADLAFLLTGLVVATVVALRLTGAPAAAQRAGKWLVALLAAQVAIGLTQYALHLPAGLVEVHLAGATLIWSTALVLNFRLTAPEPLAQTTVVPAAREATPAPLVSG